MPITSRRRTRKGSSDRLERIKRMTKKIVCLLLASASLALSSCVVSSKSSSTEEYEEESESLFIEEEEEEPEEEEENPPEDSFGSTSTEEPVDTGSSEEEPEETYTWPGEEIAYLLDYTIGYQKEIPAPSEELDAAREYSIDFGLNSGVFITAKGDFSGYYEEVMNSGGWYEIAYYDVDGNHCMHTDDLDIEIYVGAYDEASDSTRVEFRVSTGYYAFWPEEIIDEAMTSLAGEGYTPLPDFDGASYYYVNYGNSYSISQINGSRDLYLIVRMGISGDAYADSFDGFIYNQSSKVYHDPAFEYYITFSDNYERVGYCSISVMKTIATFARPSDADDLYLKVNSYFDNCKGEGVIASFPEFIEGWDLARYSTGADSVSVNYYSWDEQGAFVDLADDFKEFMEDSEEWYYIESLGLWTDFETASMALVFINSYSESVNRIYVRGGYDYTEYLPSEEDLETLE